MTDLVDLPSRYSDPVRLGGGAFGTVYRVKDNDLGVSRAMKVLASNWAADDRYRERFLREARMLRDLDNRSMLRGRDNRLVVAVYDYGELPDSRPYMVMELANRGTLAGRTGCTFEKDSFERLLGQLVDALAVVHAAGYVHRDIKPSNILLFGPDNLIPTDCLLGADEYLRLGDFGLATTADRRYTIASGTRAYAAPEQLVPGGTVDHRADVYALAVTLTELLVGRPLRAEQLAQVTETPVPLAVRAVLAQGSHPLPERRFSSAEELRNNLQVALFDSAPPGKAETLHLHWPRRRFLAGGAIAVVGAPAALWTWMRNSSGRDPAIAEGEAVVRSGERVALDLNVPEVPIPVDPEAVAADEMLFMDARNLAVDGVGNIFISDSTGHCIWRLSPEGWVNRVAGGNGPGLDSADVPALLAKLNGPEGLAVDLDGGLLVADRGSHLIRRIAPDGLMSRLYAPPDVDGSSNFDPIGIAVTESGELLVADNGGNQVWRVDRSGGAVPIAGSGAAGFAGDDGPAENALLSGPADVALRLSGEILVSDQGNRRVREIGVDGIIRTVAGNGTQAAGGNASIATRESIGVPWGLVVGSDGEILIASSSAGRVLRALPHGEMSVVAQSPSGGLGDDRLVQPTDLALSTRGQLIVADAQANRIHRVGTTGSIETVAGTGPYGRLGDNRPARQIALNGPWKGARSASGAVAVADGSPTLIRLVDFEGTTTTLGGYGTGSNEDGAPALDASFAAPLDMAYSPSGGLYLLESNKHTLRMIDPDGRVMTVLGTGEQGGEGSRSLLPEPLNTPLGLAVRSDGSVYVADTMNHRVVHIAPDAGSAKTLVDKERLGQAVIVSLSIHEDTLLALDARGGLMRFDISSGRFRLDLVTPIAEEYGIPVDVAVDADGNAFVSTLKHLILQVADAAEVVAGTGEPGFQGDGGPPKEASFSSPTGLVAHETGLLIMDNGNRRVRKISGGLVTTVAGGFYGGRA